MTSILLLSLSSLSFAADGLELKPSGFIRPTFYWVQDDPDTVSVDKTTGDTLYSDRDSFYVHGRIGFKGSFEPLRLDVAVDADVLPAFTARDAFVSVKPFSPVSLTVGQHKLPISVYQLAADAKRLLPIAPRIVANTGYGREIGAKLDLRVPVQKKVRGMLTAGLYNGEGSAKLTNENQEFLYVLRGIITPLGAREAVFEGTDREPYVGVGASWVSNLKGGATTYKHMAAGATEPLSAAEKDVTGEKYTTIAVDAQAAWRWLSLQGEYLTTRVEYGDLTKTGVKISGFYAQAGAFIPVEPVGKHLELVLRYESSDPNTTICETSDGAAVAGCVEEKSDLGWKDLGFPGRPLYQAADVVTVGTNLYYDAKAKNFHQYKLQLAWSTGLEKEGAALATEGAVKDNLLMAVASVSF